MPRCTQGSWLPALFGRPAAMRRQRKRRRRGPRFAERLEDRALLTTLTVNTLGDPSTLVVGQLSLREAIAEAGAGDTIDFAAGLSGTFTLTQGELLVQQSLNIAGPGADQITISGNNQSRIFDVDDGNATPDIQVSISGLTMSQGNGTGAFGTGSGGAIYNVEILSLSGDVISGNTATADASGSTTATATSNGGGIYNTGELTSSNDTISGNTATADANAAGGLADATSSGGGIYNSGTLSSTNDTISGNTATANAGGYGAGIEIATNGGGIDNAYGEILTSTNDTISGNTATGSGDSGGNRGGGIDNDGTLNLLNSILVGNHASNAPNVFGSINNGNSANNVIDQPVANVLATGAGGNPLLADNGGPTQTIALVPDTPASLNPALGTAVGLTTISAAVDASATAITVADPTFLAVGDALRIDGEIVVVTAVSGNTITVTRGADGSTAAAHAAGASLYLALDQRGDARERNDMGAIEGPQAPIVVTTLDDPVTPVPGQLSLREAIAQATSGSTIYFAAGLSGTVTLTQGELLITQSMSIAGPGAQQITISGNNQSRIFDVDDGNATPDIQVSIAGLTMSQGNGTGNFGSGSGGAIYNTEILTLSGDVISGNISAEGVYELVGAGDATGEGGGIYNTGMLTSTNDTISGNTAWTSVTAAGPVTTADATSHGGGIYNAGTLTSTNDTISANTATANAIAKPSAGNADASSNGGGVDNVGTFTSTNDTISGNTATVILNVPNPVGPISSGSSSGGGIYNTGTLRSTNDTISGNTAAASQVGAGSTSSNAGGIDNDGALSLLNSIVVGNHAGTGANIAGPIKNSNIADNVIDLPAGNVLATDASGNPLLADNGGPTQTIALVAGTAAAPNPALGRDVALTTISAAVDAGATTIAVADPTFLAAGDALRIDGEIVVVTAVSGNTITVTRGADGTTAAAHAAGEGLFLALDQRGYVRDTNDMGAIEGPQASIVVNTLADGHTDGQTTLREAITQADAEPYPGGTAISFAAGLDGTITLTQGELPITQSVSIAGPGADRITISGNNQSRIFDVDDGHATPDVQMSITGLTISQGNGSGNFGDGSGGGIYNAEILTLSDDVISGNAMTVIVVGGSATGNGGGIYNIGTLTSTNDSIIENTLFVQAASVVGFDDAISGGGGIYNAGTLTSTNDTIGDNAAHTNANDRGGTADDSSKGGGIYNAGTLTSTNDSISGNMASAYVTVAGHGTVSSSGGGIYNAGTLRATNDAISGNTAYASAGTPGGNADATSNGGGIDNAGTLTSTNETISGNTASANATANAAGGSAGADSNGGGIGNAGRLSSTDDTISGNTASATATGASAAAGGGISNGGILTATNDTIGGNTATNLGGPTNATSSGGGIDSSGTLNLLNNIAVGNNAGNAPNVDGSIKNSSSADNVIDQPAANVLATDASGNPLLADSGGPTQTIALVPGTSATPNPALGTAVVLTTISAAIDASATAITVADPTFLAAGDALRTDGEIVVVTAVNGNTITVTRGADGTTAGAHAAGAGLFLALDQRGYVRETNDMGAIEGPQASIVINTLANAHADGQTTLREAITQADAEPYPGGTAITFAAGLGGTITLTQGELPITQSMSIAGPGAERITISGNNQSRIFDVDDGNATPDIHASISGLTMSQGNGTGSFGSGSGGAIYNAEILTLSSDVISENTATVSATGATTGIAVSNGGAIYNSGTLSSTNDTISGNTATAAATATSSGATATAGSSGGGIYNIATLSSTNDTISGNRTTANANAPGGNANADSYGAGIYNLGTLTSANDTISGNTATSNANAPIGSNRSSSNGGGIDNGGTLNLLNSIVVGNHAATDANIEGAIANSNSADNVIDQPVANVLATDSNGNPLLADNGGPTQTIALVPGTSATPNPALGTAVALAALSAGVDAVAATIAVADPTFLAAGDALRIDGEIVVVTAVSGSTITVTRGADGTTAAPHADGAGLFLAFDQRGLARNANPDMGAFETQAPNAQYVAAVYQEVLGREPDLAGLQFWTNLLDHGAAISSVAVAIAHSAEYYANFVIKPDYLKLLGRDADAEGLAYWTAQMQNGLTDQELEAGFMSSDEFFANAGGTNVAWIDAIYNLALGRAADEGGETYWNNQLLDGATREQVAMGIAGSTENNTQLIDADYFHYLGRAADASGLEYWLGQFAEGQTNEDVIAGFTGSTEYFKDHTS